jgi:hypothetical protein
MKSKVGVHVVGTRGSRAILRVRAFASCVATVLLVLLVCPQPALAESPILISSSVVGASGPLSIVLEEGESSPVFFSTSSASTPNGTKIVSARFVAGTLLSSALTPPSMISAFVAGFDQACSAPSPGGPPCLGQFSIGTASLSLAEPVSGFLELTAKPGYAFRDGTSASLVPIIVHPVGAYYGQIAGTISDAGGSPLPEATITTGGFGIQSDGTGHYLLGHITPGSLCVDVSKQGYASASTCGLVVEQGLLLTYSVTLLADAPSVTLASSGTGSLTVTIANGPGNPTDWVAIYTNAGEYVPGAAKYLNETGAGTGVTTGTVTFTGLPSGTYIARSNIAITPSNPTAIR